MKNILIFTSILVLIIFAAIDTKSILEELAAVTPSQIELIQDIPSSKGEGVEKKFDIEKPNQPAKLEQRPQNFITPQNTSKEISPRLNPIEKRNYD